MTDLPRRTLGERVEVEIIVGGGRIVTDAAIDVNPVAERSNPQPRDQRARRDAGRRQNSPIEVANAYLEDRLRRATSRSDPIGQYVMIAVSDTGSGMSARPVIKPAPSIRSSPPSRKGKGTGLGLSQVYGFVKQSGGHVKIYSEQAAGTTVKLNLPRSKKPQEADAPSLPPRPSKRRPGRGDPGGGGDDDGVRAAVVDLLTELGYRAARRQRRAGHARLSPGQDPAHRPAVHRRGDARHDRLAELARRAKDAAPRIKKSCSRLAMLRTLSYTTASWTPMWSCSASRIGRMIWRASCAPC